MLTKGVLSRTAQCQYTDRSASHGKLFLLRIATVQPDVSLLIPGYHIATRITDNQRYGSQWFSVWWHHSGDWSPSTQGAT